MTGMPVVPAAWATAILFAIIPRLALADDLESYIREALANNPSVAVLEHEKSAAEARIPQAGVPADPVLQLDASNVPLSQFDFGTTPMSGREVRISQDFAFPGTLSTLEEAARADADAKDARLREHQNRLTADVKAAYYTVSLQDQIIGTVEEHLSLAEGMVDVASSAFSSGTGSQQTFLKARISVAEFRMELIGLRNDRETEAIRLNMLANRPLQTPVRVSSVHQHVSIRYSVEELSALAREHRPGLQEKQANRRRWDELKRNAVRRSWPGLKASLAYRLRSDTAGDPVSGSDFVSARIAVSLPLFSGRRNHMRAVEAEAMAKRSVASYQAQVLGIEARIRILYAILNRHDEELSMYHGDLLPSVQHLFESSLAAYRSGRGEFAPALSALNRLLHMRIEYHHHVTGHLKHLAELEAVVGVPLVDGETAEENTR